MPCLLKKHWIVMLRPKMVMTTPDKVNLSLRELKDPLDNWQKSTIHESQQCIQCAKNFSCPWLMNFHADLKQL